MNAIATRPSTNVAFAGQPDTALVVKATEMLAKSFKLAEEVSTRSYLLGLPKKDICPFPDAANFKWESVRLFRLQQVVLDPEENTQDKLMTVFTALQNAVASGSVFVAIRGKKSGDVEYLLGVAADGGSAGFAANTLENNFKANFAGSRMIGFSKDATRDWFEPLAKDKAVASLTVLPAPRCEEKDRFVQGMEKLTDTLAGREYTAILLATSTSREVVKARKRGLENYYTALAPFAKVSIAFGENRSVAVGESFSTNTSRTVQDGTNQSFSTSTSTTESSGTNSGSSTSLFGDTFSTGESHSTSRTDSRSESSGTSHSVSDTTGSTDTRSKTDTQGDSLTRTLEKPNKTIANLLERLDASLKRIEAAEAFGLWETSCYFISDDEPTARLAANTYKALVTGDASGHEDIHLNVWSPVRDPERTENALSYLAHARHPLVRAFPDRDDLFVPPANLVSGRDLPLLLGLPLKTIPGMVVNTVAGFGRNIFVKTMLNPDRRTIGLGNIFHKGTPEETRVDLDLDSLTAHCFISGTTGSGKSTTTYTLLTRLMENDIPFLVIEPAKGEYKDEFAGVPDIHIYTTNPQYHKMLRINPFEFLHPHIHVLEHIDRLIEIFNVCWEMYAAMPAILKDGIEMMYIKKGWDIENSYYISDGAPQFPTFADLLAILPEILDASDYSAQAKGDYKGALVTRVKSLANGLFGQIFCAGYSIPDKTLFDERAIVDLSRIGSTESKALIMGILVMRLGEYRSFFPSGNTLRHITVLEEAHNLLKRTDAGASRLISKSVEMISNSIAEMRSKGEGFMIIDQSPTAVDISAIKNTNTKIIMRLPEATDCEVAGSAFGLNEFQIKEIPRLETGVAIVMQNNWVEPVLAKIDRTTRPAHSGRKVVDAQTLSRIRGALCKALLTQRPEFLKTGRLDIGGVLVALDTVPGVLPEKHEEFAEFFEKRQSSLSSADTPSARSRWLGLLLLDLLCCRSVFRHYQFPIPAQCGAMPTEAEIATFITWKNNLVTSLKNYLSDAVDYAGRRQLFVDMVAAVQQERKSEKLILRFYNYVLRVGRETRRRHD